MRYYILAQRCNRHRRWSGLSSPRAAAPGTIAGSHSRSLHRHRSYLALFDLQGVKQMAVPDQTLDMPSQPADPAYQRELGSGLVLRWSAAADAAGVARLMGQVWSIGPHEPVNPRV